MQKSHMKKISDSVQKFISKKKVNRTIKQKKYGPFVVDLPKMSTSKMYKFNSCYTRYWNKISHFLADEYIDRIGSRIVPYKEKHFDNQHMGSLKLESSLLSKSQGKNENARWNMSKTLFALWLVKVILRDCAKLKYSLTYFLSLFALWLVQIMLVFMPLCQSNPRQMHFSRLIHFLKRKILIFLRGIATFVHFLIVQNYP